MSDEKRPPRAEEYAAEGRNARGEWRPDYPVRFAPLLQWPLRLRALAKWFFGWPGYLWPLSSVIFAFAALSWFLFQPEMARCTQFEWSWIAQIYVRNLVIMWVFYGSLHYYLYIRKGDGRKRKYDANWPARNSRLFLFRDQIYDNIFWTCGIGGIVWSGYEVITMWLYANDYIPWLTWARHPVWFVALFLLIPIWREFHFYWIHRLIHWKPLYKHVHYLHHKNINPNAWSGMAMHPVELILYISVVLIHWVVPSHPLHFLYNLQHTTLTPGAGHHGFEGPIANGKVPTGSYFHYLHHRYFECNYGEATIPFDRWFGTFRDGLPEGEGSKLAGEHKD